MENPFKVFRVSWVSIMERHVMAAHLPTLCKEQSRVPEIIRPSLPPCYNQYTEKPPKVLIYGMCKSLSSQNLPGNFHGYGLHPSFTAPVLLPGSWRNARPGIYLSKDQGSCPPEAANTISKPPLMVKSLKGSKVTDPGNSSSILIQVKSL